MSKIIDFYDSEIAESIGEHLEELRMAIIQVFLILIAGMGLCFCFYPHLFSLLTAPLKEQTNLSSPFLQKECFLVEKIQNKGEGQIAYFLSNPEARLIKSSPGVQRERADKFLIPRNGSLEIERKHQLITPLAIFSPGQGILLAFKICFLSTLVLTSPLWLAVCLKFILPGLKKGEQALIFPFLGLTFLMVGCGCLAAYYITIPFANAYLLTFNEALGVNLWGLEEYLDYTLLLLATHAAAFEIGVVLLFLVHQRILTPKLLISNRKHAIVGAFILGAILTPPDIFTQLSLASLLILIYEGAILYAKYRNKIRSLSLYPNMH